MSQEREPESQDPSSATTSQSAAVRDTDSRKKQPERRGPPPNPLYHPLFLPILMIGFSLWFGYDGFLTRDPAMLKHQTFNRVMFFVMFPICLWMVPRGIKEFREDQAKAANEQIDGKSS